jgi:AraC-like DNA-binding protein
MRGLQSEMGRGQSYGWHRHDEYQLAYAATGRLRVAMRDWACTISARQAILLPAAVEHEVTAVTGAAFHSVYWRPDAEQSRDDGARVVDVSPLLHELILKSTGLAGVRHAARRWKAFAEAICCELDLPPESTVPERPAGVTRGQRVADRLSDDPADARPLRDIACQIGCSEKTLSRAFRAELGLPFGEWRRNARIRHAIRLLEAGHRVAEVADRVGYSSVSAFIAMFRRYMDCTPGQYRERRVEPDRESSTRG